jgi:uncharacterized protein YjbI with pentapeptide repeats
MGNYMAMIRTTNAGLDYLALLEEGVDAWNQWRHDNPQLQPDLSGADLSDMDLSGANLSAVDLCDADLFQTRLRDANLKMSVLSGADMAGADLAGAELYKVDLTKSYLTGVNLTSAYLVEANLAGADMRAAILEGADLTGANLQKANLSEANLSRANLTNADISHAVLCHANLSEANVLGIEYGEFHELRGRYFAIRGLDSAFGNALFVRDAQDQDYLDTLENSIERTEDRRLRKFKRFWFSTWSFVDYGRSLGRPTVYALILATLYGLIYLLDMKLGWGLMNYSNSAESWLTPFYYSIVTYTTLGFGDITPKHWIGEIIVISEVILGYTTLGLLLSILANKVARRS